jgi:hypothetical protein
MELARQQPLMHSFYVDNTLQYVGAVSSRTASDAKFLFRQHSMPDQFPARQHPLMQSLFLDKRCLPQKSEAPPPPGFA